MVLHCSVIHIVIFEIFGWWMTHGFGFCQCFSVNCNKWFKPVYAWIIFLHRWGLNLLPRLLSEPESDAANLIPIILWLSCCGLRWSKVWLYLCEVMQNVYSRFLIYWNFLCSDLWWVIKLNVIVWCYLEID